MYRKLILTALAGLLVTGSVGCLPLLVAAGAAVGGYQYSEGVVWRDYKAAPREIRNAAVAAIQSLGFTLEKDRVDAYGGEVTAVRAAGGDVKISIKMPKDGQTRVGVPRKRCQSPAKVRQIFRASVSTGPPSTRGMPRSSSPTPWL